MGRWLVAAMFLLGMAGCRAEPSSTRTDRYPSPDGSAVLRVDVENYGGAAGFVLNRVSLDVGGQAVSDLRRLEHLSSAQAVWIGEKRVRFCYVGSMDRGEPRWTGTVNGQTYEIDFQQQKTGQICTNP